MPAGRIKLKRAPKYPPQLAQGQIVLHEMFVDQTHVGQDKGHPNFFAAVMTFALLRDKVHWFWAEVWFMGLDVFKPVVKLSLQLMA